MPEDIQTSPAMAKLRLGGSTRAPHKLNLQEKIPKNNFCGALGRPINLIFPDCLVGADVIAPNKQPKFKLPKRIQRKITPRGEPVN